MYIEVNIDSLDKKYLDYELCYVKRIPETVLGVSDEYRDVIEQSGMSVEDYIDTEGNDYVRLVDVSNPEYVEGKCEMVAYFIKDIPDCLECNWNSDRDYIDEIEPSDKVNGKEVELVKCKFALNSVDCTLPHEWFINEMCPFDIDDVNAGAVAWVFTEDPVRCAFNGGCKLCEFKNKVSKINSNG